MNYYYYYYFPCVLFCFSDKLVLFKNFFFFFYIFLLEKRQRYWCIEYGCICIGYVHSHALKRDMSHFLELILDQTLNFNSPQVQPFLFLPCFLYNCVVNVPGTAQSSCQESECGLMKDSHEHTVVSLICRNQAKCHVRLSD